MKLHKLFLISFIILESVTLSAVGYWLYQNRVAQKVNAQKITVLEKENLIFPENDEYPHFYTHKPSMVEEVTVDWLDYKPHYTYNADGLHDRFDYTIEKPPGTFRIITLGDSFTFGQMVDTKDNWTELLEDKLNSERQNCTSDRYEVINLGMPGYDIPYIAHRYETLGAKYNPDLILWFESSSGYLRFNELTLPPTKACLEKLKSDPAFSETDENELYEKCANETYAHVMQQYTQTEISNELKGYLGRFIANHHNTVFYSFDYHSWADYEKDTAKEWASSFPEVRFLPVVPGLNDLGQSLADGHPNKEGHVTIANKLYQSLHTDVLPQLCKAP